MDELDKKNVTNPVNALFQPEVQHSLHLLQQGRVAIIQVRLTCLSLIRNSKSPGTGTDTDTDTDTDTGTDTGTGTGIGTWY